MGNVLLAVVSKQNYDPEIQIHNRSDEMVQVAFWSDRLLDNVTIPAKAFGFVTIPDKPNWDCECPMNALLNDRKLHIVFQPSGTTTEFCLTYLICSITGHFKEDVVITERKTISNESDPNLYGKRK